jgi:hypothetical protein
MFFYQAIHVMNHVIECDYNCLSWIHESEKVDWINVKTLNPCTVSDLVYDLVSDLVSEYESE